MRFRRLSQPAQLVTGYASVLDRRFDAEVMARLLDQPALAVVAALDELEWSRWLVSDARGYTFAAHIMRDVVAQDMLTEGQRRNSGASQGTDRAPRLKPGLGCVLSLKRQSYCVGWSLQRQSFAEPRL